MKAHVVRTAVVGAALALAAAAPAQPPDAPTKKDPIRFSAFAVSMQGGRAGRVEIAIERWTITQDKKKEKK